MQKPNLTSPPHGERARELWIGHAAGFILVRDIRDYARALIDPSISAEARAAALKSIDDAFFGVMEVLDQYPDQLENDQYKVTLETRIVLWERRDNDWIEVQSPAPEGWCMGYHYWLEGDFGDDPPVIEQAYDG